MRLRTLIKKLKEIEKKHGNMDVVVDFEDSKEDGWLYYNLEKAQFVKSLNYKNKIVYFLNLKSSNEA